MVVAGPDANKEATPSDGDSLRIRFRKQFRKFRFEGKDYGPYEINNKVILPKKAATKLIDAKVAFAIKEEACLNKDSLRVLFRKNCPKFNFEGTDYGPYQIDNSVILPKKAATKLIDAKVAVIDLDEMSIRDVLDCFLITDFETYFDRKRILGYLQKKADLFNNIAKRKKICPNCENAMIPGFMCEKGVLREYKYCRVCKTDKERKLLGSRLEDWAIASSIHNIFQGKLTNEVKQSLMMEARNRLYDFGIGEKLPANGSLIEMPSRISEKLEHFNKLMMLIIGGIDCKKLQVDDIFERKKKKKAPLELVKKKRSRKRKGGFFYPIVAVDEDSKFYIDIPVRENRNKSAYGVAFAMIKEALRPGSLIICRGDKLSAMEEAARKYLPKEVILDFQSRPYYFPEDKEKKYPFYDKGPCNIIERKNKDLRKTLKKRETNQTSKQLKVRATINKHGENYLRPYNIEELTEKWEARPYPPKEVKEMRAAQRDEREAARKSRKLVAQQLKMSGAKQPRKKVSKPIATAAQMVGIPYPFDPWNWRLFLMWVDWIHVNLTEILKVGLK